MTRKRKEPILTTDNLLSLTSLFDEVDEHRFVVAALGSVNQRQLMGEDMYYPVNIYSYCEKSGTDLGRAYLELKELVEKFRQTSYKVRLDTGEIWVISLIHSYLYDDDNLTLRVKWNRELIPYISGEQKDNTYCIAEGAVAGLSSSHQIRLLGLLQRHLYKLNTKPYSFSISTIDIRRHTGTLGTYREYYELSRNVIKPGVAEVLNILGVRLDYKGNKREVTFWRK